MIKAIKSKMLTYLFKDWVMNETDLETLQVSKQFIKKREIYSLKTKNPLHKYLKHYMVNLI